MPVQQPPKPLMSWAHLSNCLDIHVFLRWTYGSGGCAVHHVSRNIFDHLRLRESYAEAAFAAEEAISIYQEGCAAASKRNLRVFAFSVSLIALPGSQR